MCRTASSIPFSETYCSYGNQNTSSTMTAGTQGTGGRFISHVCSFAKVALSQGDRRNPKATQWARRKFITRQIWSVSRLPKTNLLFNFSLITLLGSIIYQQRAAETGQDVGSIPRKQPRYLAGLCGIYLSFSSRKRDLTHLKVFLSHTYISTSILIKIISRFIFGLCYCCCCFFSLCIRSFPTVNQL